MLQLAGLLALFFILNALATAVLWIARDAEEKAEGSRQ